MSNTIERTDGPEKILEFFRQHPVDGMENPRLSIAGLSNTERYLAAALLLAHFGGESAGAIYWARVTLLDSSYLFGARAETRPLLVLNSDADSTPAYLNDDSVAPLTAGELRNDPNHDVISPLLLRALYSQNGRDLGLHGSGG